MSIQINIGDHVSPFAPFFVPVPFKHQFATKWARNRAKMIAANLKTADKYFKSLPGKRTLTQLLADRRIWINYAPELYGRGMRQEGSNEIGIGELAYLRGKEDRVSHPDSRAGAHRRSSGWRLARRRRRFDSLRPGKQSEADRNINDPSTPYDPDARG